MRLVKYRGKWCAYTGRGQRVSLRTDKRSIAEQRLADLLKTGVRSLDTVGQVVDKYLVSNTHKISYRNMVGRWKSAKPFFENLRPDHITREVCREYTLKRRKFVSAETIRKEIGVIRSAMRWHNPSTPAIFELPPAPPPRESYMTRDEYDRLLSECKAPHLRLFVMLALATAGRKSSLLELTWDRVDFESSRIRLGTGEKRSKGRATVPMTQTLREALLMAKEGALTDYVIEYGAKPVKDIKTGFMSAAKKAGLDVTPHDLRRTAAIWMVESGIPIIEVAQYLGHTTPSITYKVYARFSPDYLKKAANALEHVQRNKKAYT